MENQNFPLLIQEEKIKNGKSIFSPPDSGGKNKKWKINIFPS
jgi:hypothetical protein